MGRLMPLLVLGGFLFTGCVPPKIRFVGQAKIPGDKYYTSSAREISVIVECGKYTPNCAKAVSDLSNLLSVEIVEEKKGQD